MHYWLLKTEPGEFSWADLSTCPNRTAQWEGVRNYQARNFLKAMEVGDLVLFYHSVVKPQIIAGIAKVVETAYPDPTAFDPESPYFDRKSDPNAPRWFVVDVEAKCDVIPPITRDDLKSIAQLQDMMLLKRGCRLSVQPVRAEEWRIICRLRNLQVR